MFVPEISGQETLRPFRCLFLLVSDMVRGLHNVGRGRGGVDAALSSIRAACTVVGIDSDCLFPVDEQRYLADRIPGARFHEINSRFGHDGFLLEYPQLTAVMAPLLEEMDRDGRV